MNTSETIFKDTLPHLPLSLCTLCMDAPQEYVDRPHGVEPWQWIQCTQGQGELILDHKVFRVHPGDGIFLPGNTPHIYHQTAPLWKVNYLLFNGPHMASIMEPLGLTEAGVYRLSDPELILSQEKALYEAYIKKPSDAAEHSKRIYGILLDLSADITKNQIISENYFNPKIHAAITYMYQNFMKPVSIQNIADAVGLTREYLCQLFKKSTGLTLLDHLLLIRMVHAKTLLMKHSKMTMGEIARCCGFETASYFCAVFKKCEKLTPGQFRKNSVKNIGEPIFPFHSK